jgi:hypothetical protein
MSLRSKAIKGSGLTKLRSTVTTSDGTTETEVETWTGPYSQLLTKRNAVKLSVKGTNLSPTEANHGQLTITRETDISAESGATVPNQSYIEVLWMELRRPVETNPYFDSVSAETKKLVKLAAESADDGAVAGFDTIARDLYDMLIAGTTEWSTGVPVVRRTTTKRVGNEAKGNAWFRDTPPVEVEGDWDYLKTADETRRDGKSYTQTEEWTGGKNLSEKLYPIADP